MSQKRSAWYLRLLRQLPHEQLLNTLRRITKKTQCYEFQCQQHQEQQISTPSYLGSAMATLINGPHCLSDTHYKTQPTNEAIKILIFQKHPERVSYKHFRNPEGQGK